MTGPSRRALLFGGAATAVGLSLRAAITGLPLPFLLTGRALAEEPFTKVVVLSCSGAGESTNTHGPGTYDAERPEAFTHAKTSVVDQSEVPSVTVGGRVLTSDDLEHSELTQLGSETVRMARCWAALPAGLRKHLVWFNHRTRAGIHPQYGSVLGAWGALRGETGRGNEILPSALAQELAPLLGTTTSDVLSLSGRSFTSRGAPLAAYTPTQLRAITASVTEVEGGVDRFDQLFDRYIDEAYRTVRDEGTAPQRRFFDQHAASRSEARDFGIGLASALDGIEDDGINSQIRAALAIARLRLAPVIAISHSFSGDNHQDKTLTVETAKTLAMMRSLEVYWETAAALGVQDDVLYATSDVFGRPTRAKNGRGHGGRFASALMIGTHLRGGVVGGITYSDRGDAMASGMNSGTGLPTDADIDGDETLESYYKSVFRAAGMPRERRDVRLPHHLEVTSFV